MNLFGDIMFQENYNADANFRSYMSAMMMLFRSVGYRSHCMWSPPMLYTEGTSLKVLVALNPPPFMHRMTTGDNWNAIMWETMVETYCIQVRILT